MELKQIPLSNGGFAIVDEDDFEFINRWKWKRHIGGYAFRTGYDSKSRKFIAILMHRVINKTPQELETDHINLQKLDNRKSNLRNSTRSKNEFNKLPRSDNTSGYAGICWDKSRNKWLVRVSKKQIGRFSNLQDAIDARSAIVPQVAEVIFRAIKKVEEHGGD